MSGYQKMWLVKPELLANKQGAVQSDYYQRQKVREQLRPDGSLIEILSHLQDKVKHVLTEPTTAASSKIRKYNQLMNKSQILMKKARTVGRGAHSMNPNTLRNHTPEYVDGSTSEHTPEPFQDSDSDTESESEIEEAFFDASPHPTPPPSHTRATREDVHDFKEDIKKIPHTYRENVQKLYNILSTQATGKGVNWNQKGELVINKEVIRGSNIVELLTDVARPKSKSKVPVGRDVFLKVVKGLNPTLKHVRNKILFKTGSTPKKSTPKKKKPTQIGHGRTPFKWQTRL